MPANTLVRKKISLPQYPLAGVQRGDKTRAAFVGLPRVIIENPYEPVAIPKRMQWTASSLRLFRKCKRKFFWKYVMRLRSRGYDMNLSTGGCFHNCLGEWYKGRRASMRVLAQRHEANLKRMYDESAAYYDQEDLDKFDTMVKTFVGMMIGYETIYAEDKRTWDIVRDSIEKVFVVDCGEFDYTGKIDLITRINGTNDYEEVEHKTVSRRGVGAGYIERLPIDTQIRGYVFGAKRGLGINVKRVLYDVVRKCALRRKSNERQHEFTQRIADDYIARPDFYFYRERIPFARQDIDAFEFELHQTHREYQSIADELRGAPAAQAYKVIAQAAGIDDAEKYLVDPRDPRAWAPNDETCDEYFRDCSYLPLCTRGLDRGTGALYDQSSIMHEELAVD